MEGALYAGCVFFYGDAFFLCSSPFVMYYGVYMAFCNKNRDLFCIMINYLYLCWQIRSKDCFGLKKVFSYYEKTLFKMCCYRAHLFLWAAGSQMPNHSNYARTSCANSECSQNSSRVHVENMDNARRKAWRSLSERR